jgi:hypothetical protein
VRFTLVSLGGNPVDRFADGVRERGVVPPSTVLCSSLTSTGHLARRPCNPARQHILQRRGGVRDGIAGVAVA